MHRRDLLKSLASGAGLVASQTAPLPAQGARLIGAKEAAPEKRFIETRDGTGLFYKASGSGRPFVLVAPYALSSDWWEYQTTYLAGQGLRCIAYDRRGHGRSGWPMQGYEFNTLADDLASVIEQLDLHDVTLVG